MDNLCQLPYIILLRIMAYLPVDNILNLRLTCQFMYRLTKCKEFYKRISIDVYFKVKSCDVEMFKSLLEEHGSNLRFKRMYFYNDMNLILPYLSKVEDIWIDTRYLEDICIHCTQIKKLGISLDYLIPDTEKREVDFTFLSKLQKLEELSIGCFKAYGATLCKSTLYDILVNATTISKIYFIDIYCIAQTNFKKHHCERKLNKLLIKVIKNASHIKEWSLFNIFCSEKVFEFPDDVRSIECRNVNCAVIKNQPYKSIQKLVTRGEDLCSEEFEFVNLKQLELTGDLTYPGLKESAVVCPQLEVLCLREILDIEKLEPFLSSTLKVLELDTRSCSHDNILKRIMARCTSLSNLTIVDDGWAWLNNFQISKLCMKSALDSRPKLKIIFSKFLKNDVVFTLRNFDQATFLFDAILL